MSELFKILLDGLRKQAFPVVLLFIAVAALVFDRERQEGKFNLQIASFETRLQHCMDQHNADQVVIADLKSTVATLTERVNIVAGLGASRRR